MASYHWSMQIIGRKNGRSAVRAAAYRAGQDLKDDRSGEVHSYGQRRGVYHTEIILPGLAHSRLGDRETLWNEVERVERRADAQLAREVNIALPHELSREQQLDLIRGYVRSEFVARGMIADLAVHVPRPGRGEDERNVHAHVMLTLRQATPQGLHPVKTREWNSRDVLKHWRSAWAEHANRALTEAGHLTRIDARSLDDQRVAALARGNETDARSLAREPELHMGPNAVAMARATAWRRARVLMQRTSHADTGPVPDKFAENAVRIDRNWQAAWRRLMDAKVGEVRLATSALHENGVSPRAVSGRHGASNFVQQTPPVPTAQAQTRGTKMKEMEWKGMPEVTTGAALQVSARDVVFACYRMGLLSREQLSTSLELIAAEQALQRASARQEQFWSRVLPRRQAQRGSQVRRRYRASGPKVP